MQAAIAELSPGQYGIVKSMRPFNGAQAYTQDEAIKAVNLLLADNGSPLTLGDGTSVLGRITTRDLLLEISRRCKNHLVVIEYVAENMPGAMSIFIQGGPNHWQTLGLSEYASATLKSRCLATQHNVDEVKGLDK